MSDDKLQDLRGRIEQLSDKLEGHKRSPRKWLRWSVLAACLGLPVGTWGLDPSATFTRGNAILAADFQAMWDAVVTLEASDEDHESRLAAVEAVDADARIPSLEAINAESRLSALETGPVVVRCALSAGTTTPTWTLDNDTRVDFDTCTTDTLSAVTTGSSWRFVAPRNGHYAVSTHLQSATGTPQPHGTRTYVYVNGLVVSEGRHVADASNALIGRVTDVVTLSEGDHVYFMAFHAGSGGSVDFSTSVTDNWVSIHEIR